MKLLLRISNLTGLLCASFTILALILGHFLPSATIAFNETCADATRAYIADGLHKIRFKLAENGFLNSIPTWSPDGNQLAIATTDEDNYKIYLTNLATGSTRILANDAFGILPSWSPDGRYIVFITDDMNSQTISAVEVTTGIKRAFPFVVPTNFAHAWSPNGQHLAFAGYDNNSESILLLNMITGKADHITDDQFISANYPSWSPNGKWLIFSAFQNGVNKIYIRDVDAGSIKPLSKNTTFHYITTAWSPDGQYIAATTTESEIHILNITGDIIRSIDLKQIPGISAGDALVTWSPDGNYLAVHVPINYQWANYLININTLAAYDLSFAPCIYSNISWRPQ